MASTHDWYPPPHDLVREHSSEASTRKVDRLTRGALDEVGDSPQRIRARLAELDREWHLDRALVLMFSGLGAVTASRTMRSLREKTAGRLGTRVLDADGVSRPSRDPWMVPARRAAPSTGISYRAGD